MAFPPETAGDLAGWRRFIPMYGASVMMAPTLLDALSFCRDVTFFFVSEMDFSFFSGFPRAR